MQNSQAKESVGAMWAEVTGQRGGNACSTAVLA